MTAGIPIQVILPVIIAMLMLGIGMSLRIADFSALISHPRATGLGLLNLFVIFPALAFLFAWIFPLPPELRVGLVLLAACPSASTSNFFTYLARGDVALSITLTAISKIVPVLTVPFYVSLAAALFADTDTSLTLSFADTSERLLHMVLLPTVIGMALRHRFPAVAEHTQRSVKRLAVIALVLLIAALIIRERTSLAQMLLSAGLPALSLCLAGMLFAFVSSTQFGLQEPRRNAITIEVGMQSGGTAIAIAAGILAQPAMAIPAAVYSLLMYGVAAGFVYWQRSALASPRLQSE